MGNNLASSKDNDEEHVMYLKSHKKEIMINGIADERIEKSFKFKQFLVLLNRYWNDLETSMTGSDFIFDCINLLYYKCHKINASRGGSYTGSPDWIKK